MTERTDTATIDKEGGTVMEPTSWRCSCGKTERHKPTHHCEAIPVYDDDPGSTEAQHAPPSVADGTVAQGLIDGLRHLIDEYGEAGVRSVLDDPDLSDNGRTETPGLSAENGRNASGEGA